MANINGIEIKAVKTFLGMEGYARQGNVYMDNKKIGFYSEDGDGGCSWIDFACNKEIKTLFYDKVRSHFRKNPVPDHIIIYNMTLEEYAQNENNLPVMKYEQESKETVMEYFMEELLDLRELEQDYKKAVKKGYSAIVAVNYTSLSGNPLPLNEVYFTNGTQGSIDKVKSVAKKKSIAVTVKAYISPVDFKIM